MDAASFLPSAVGCITCDPVLWTGIREHRFWLLLLTIAPGLLIGAVAVAGMTGAWARKVDTGGDGQDAAALPWAATMLGMGLGGFADGIVLHQVLQVHAMISNSLPPDTVLAKSVNMFWDGIFHIAAWVLTLVGVVALWRIVRQRETLISGAIFWGGLLHGWGAFNVLDSVLNHFVFGYHNVVEISSAPWAWNLAFLAFGVAQVGAGLLIMRHGIRSAVSASDPRLQ